MWKHICIQKGTKNADTESVFIDLFQKPSGMKNSLV